MATTTIKGTKKQVTITDADRRKMASLRKKFTSAEIGKTYGLSAGSVSAILANYNR